MQSFGKDREQVKRVQYLYPQIICIGIQILSFSTQFITLFVQVDDSNSQLLVMTIVKV